MSIHRVYALISPFFRRRRMRNFILRMQPDAQTTILDVGGYSGNWDNVPIDSKITILNVDPKALSTLRGSNRIEVVTGDGCRLDYKDKSFDIVFSNSVIEHVGTFEQQKSFANEVRRVGKALWIQTPARSFFIEPHLLTPFVHFLPRSVQKRLLRHLTLWGVLTKPTPERVDQFLRNVRLLNEGEIKQLFPDCQILHERVAGMTKSFIALRDS